MAADFLAGAFFAVAFVAGAAATDAASGACAAAAAFLADTFFAVTFFAVAFFTAVRPTFLAGKIGFSAEELAKLLSESEAVRRRTGNTEALESQSSSVERHGLPPTLNQQPNADAQAAVAAARPSEVDTVVSC